PATFIVNALAPAEVTKVVLDEDTHRVEVVVPDERLSLGIGRRGQNVRLASQLTSWQIDILTEAEESERRQKEFAQRTQLFMESLDVDETVAQLLASEGFATIEDLARCATDDLIGYFETGKDKERVRVPGALESFGLSSDEANGIVMKARVKAGWIEELPEEVAVEEGNEGEEPTEA